MDTQFKFKYLEIQLQKVEIIGISTVCTPNGSLVIQLPPKSSLVIQLQEDTYFWLQLMRRYLQLGPKIASNDQCYFLQCFACLKYRY